MSFRSEYAQWQDEIHGRTPLLERVVARFHLQLSALAVIAIVSAVVLGLGVIG